MLAGLAAGIECSRNLRAAKGAIGKETAVLARERNPLRNALVDDQGADLGEAINIRFAGAKVPAFDRVIEKPVNAVAVVLIVLRGVDSALGGDGMGAARAILITKAFDVEALLAERCGGGGARQPAAHDDKLVLSLVRGADNLGAVLVGRPLFIEGPGRGVCVERHGATPFPRPKKRIDTGIEVYPMNKIQANTRRACLVNGTEFLDPLNPKV